MYLPAVRARAIYRGISFNSSNFYSLPRPRGSLANIQNLGCAEGELKAYLIQKPGEIQNIQFKVSVLFVNFCGRIVAPFFPLASFHLRYFTAPTKARRPDFSRKLNYSLKLRAPSLPA